MLDFDTTAFSLTIPPPKVLTDQEELALFECAYEKDAASLAVRRTLVRLLVKLDHFERALALLRGWKSQDLPLLLLQTHALLSLETDAANEECEGVCRLGLQVVAGEHERSSVLSLLAKVLGRLHRPEEARLVLEEALRYDPAAKDAFKRAANLELNNGAPQKTLARTGAMIAAGQVHARVVASQSLALAQLGMIEESRQSQGLEQFLLEIHPEVPAGWASMAKFTRDLAVEIGSHPGMRYERYGTAASRTWRVDEPALVRLCAISALQKMIRREVSRYVQQLPAGKHPFLQARPSTATLHDWCVLTAEDGHEEWHMHQSGWLSGTFYIQVPQHITESEDKSGCIAFGLPQTVGEDHARAYGEVCCRPRAGLMLLFPSHTFHRTYPHGGPGRRICYAFDVVPSSIR